MVGEGTWEEPTGAEDTVPGTDVRMTEIGR